MDKEEQKKPLTDLVLEAVKKGQVTMRPKWHFVLKTILAIVGVTLLLLVLWYLISFIMFILWQTGVWDVRVFGIKGWYAFLLSLPWLLIVLVTVFVCILEVLVRHYSFAYRRPLLYSALGIVLLSILGGYTVAKTSLHDKLFISAEKHMLPYAGPMYLEYGHRPLKHVHKGRIMAPLPNGFTMQNPREGVLTVTIHPRTRLPRGTDFYAGDMVVVFGERDTDMIQAHGIQKIWTQSDR